MIVFKKARTKSDLDDIHRLRFRVLCQERMAERESRHPTGRDQDVFDEYAVHAMARHFDLTPLGTMRLVGANPLGFPMENFYGARITRKEQAAEVSKLAVSRLGLRLAGVSAHEVLKGLVGVLLRESRNLGISWWYVMLSPGMHRLLERWGIRPHPVESAEGAERAYVIEASHVEAVYFVNDKRPSSVRHPLDPLSSGPARARRSAPGMTFH